MSMKSNPICMRPGCLKPITNADEQKEKTFIIVETGQVIALRRHDACAEKYDGAIKRATDVELRALLSPASARKNMLADRRRNKENRRVSENGKAATR